MPTWRDFTTFIRFAIYSILTLSAVVAAWTALGLPLFASQAYVDSKFKITADNNLAIQSQLTSTRIQLNKMNRQSLEREKYRLSKEVTPNFDTTKRLQDIEEELRDTQRERDILLRP